MTETQRLIAEMSESETALWRLWFKETPPAPPLGYRPQPIRWHATEPHRAALEKAEEDYAWLRVA